MKLYLTSATGGQIKKDGIRFPAPIFRANNFLDHLMKHWKQNSKMLHVRRKTEAEEIEIEVPVDKDTDSAKLLKEIRKMLD